MNLEELREATKQYDGPLDLSKTKPLTKRQRAQWERMQKGPSYSIRVYRGKKRAVRICLEQSLIDWSERYAQEHHMTRDEVIEKSLRGLQSFAQ
jgi:hypothetical protein